jgi:hypothetical protein
MNIKKMVITALAAMTLSWVPCAYAADNGTEFGIEDDLSVFGSQGTALDPDAEIKGFTVFGSTQSAYTGAVVGAGNVVVNGYLAVSSGAYLVSNSTFAAGSYFMGSSTFAATVNLPAPTSLYVSGGSNGQVMTKNSATGTLQWADVSSMVSGDNLGNHIATMTLQMSNFGIVNVASITANGYITTYSSMTVGGAAGIGGVLNVNGDADLNAKLNVDGASTFVSSMTALGNTQQGDAYTDTHGVNMAPAADTGLVIAGQQVAGDYVVKLYSGTLLSAWLRKK